MTTSLTTPFLILDKQQVRSNGTDIYLFHCCKWLRNKVKTNVYENKEQCCGIIDAKWKVEYFIEESGGRSG